MKGGVNFAELWRANGGLDITDRTGFMGGGFVQAAFTPHAGLRIEGLWVSKGAEFASDDSSVEIDYLEFPILFVIGIPAGANTAFSVFVGPTFGANTSATSNKNGTSVDIDNYLVGFEFGIAMGIGFQYSFSSISVVVDGRYAAGLNSAFVDSSHRGWSQMSNRGIGIMAGVAFPLGTGVQ
jgi:hypothetical protein